MFRVLCSIAKKVNRLKTKAILELYDPISTF